MMSDYYVIRDLGELDYFYSGRNDVINEVVELFQEPKNPSPDGFWYSGVLYFTRDVRGEDLYFQEKKPYYFAQVRLAPYTEEE
jgi:hypothetical protein